MTQDNDFIENDVSRATDFFRGSRGSQGSRPSARVWLLQARRINPAPQVYRMVAEELDVAPAAICTVAAHVWDTIGAQSVGYFGSASRQAGQCASPGSRVTQPQVVAPDIPSVAAQMIRLWC
jgi:hypothetical protein